MTLVIGNNMKKHGFKPVFLLVLVIVTFSLLSPSFGAPQTNTVGWSDNFETYTNLTPLIDGTNGWYASDSGCIVQTNVYYSATNAAMLPVDVTLSNRFSNAYTRIVKLEMFIQPQLYNGTNYPVISSNIAAQFFVNSNGFFVVGNGTNWEELTKKAGGADAQTIANTHFTKIQVNLRYKNHTWNLKAWSNTTLMASTYYVNFTSNLNTFSGFDIYNGNATSYVDNVSVITGRQSKVNGVPFDTIKSINGAQPAAINGVSVNE